MSEPRVKRIKTCLPLCETHLSSAESPARQNFPTVVEEGLCGVSTLLMEVSYRLEALAETFERSDLALPRVSAYFHQESAKELERAETMLQYLSQRGGKHCSKNIQRLSRGMEGRENKSDGGKPAEISPLMPVRVYVSLEFRKIVEINVRPEGQCINCSSRWIPRHCHFTLHLLFCFLFFLFFFFLLSSLP
ncbi:ferritin light chain, oocyte isoform-like isoform X2 [Puntigrus tetrazona]|uniref:ferritin light chain, oocyte isoform-like isoform X2 n=1 Tax=Puntigrus tetrazona TaxID=1606681 RepID=UPI001C891D8C|nr:ferritin light chain, oocyte isoform-like isoform X2 [Puntigrus tetrazona]